MKASKNLLIVVLVLAVGGLGALAWNQYKQLIVLRSKVLASADLQRQLDDASHRIHSLQDQIASLNRRRRSSAVGDQVAGGDNGPGGPPGQGNGRRGGRGFAAMQAMLNNPEFQKLAAVQMKAQIANRYGALIKQLNLSPEQAEQLENLLVQRQQAARDAATAAFQQGINPRTDPQSFQQAMTDAQSAVDQQIQAALGDSSYAVYQQYQQTMPERNTVSQVQQALVSASGVPLTDAQQNQLVQLLAQNAPASQTGGGGGGFGGFGGPFGGGGQNQTATITSQDLTLAQSVLSSSQLQALQQVAQQQQAQQQMQQLMRSARQANGNGGGGGGG